MKLAATLATIWALVATIAVRLAAAGVPWLIAAAILAGLLASVFALVTHDLDAHQS